MPNTLTIEYSDWVSSRSHSHWGTNHGSDVLPYQWWRHFKESFSPEFIAEAIIASNITVESCLDPFGGSGTTPLTCQFLGVKSTTVEVNPFLADLIEAKLTAYDLDALARSLNTVVTRATKGEGLAPDYLPKTFVEPGVNGRWVFDGEVARAVFSLLIGIEDQPQPMRRLFKVLLGGVLINISNVVVNGKGRRYRRGDRKGRRYDFKSVLILFEGVVKRAVQEIQRFGKRPESQYQLIRGDSRAVSLPGSYDLAIFSPPYPNSFDYTDVYNVELWTLGYLKNKFDNQTLRRSTLTSHVQLGREFLAHPAGSAVLDEVMLRLSNESSRLWDPRLPKMVASYFAELTVMLERLSKVVRPKGQAWIVIGDSKYAGVLIPTASILAEYAPSFGWSVRRLSSLRSMRSSNQHGGRRELSETLLVLEVL